MDEEIWGADAAEFKPERWDNIPETAVSGAWPSLFCFSAGPRHCIGFRFAVVEMKAILFTLLPAFEIAAAVPEDAMVASPAAIQKPTIRGELGPRMPLIMRPYVAAH
ncbi:cytochrome P450 [Mycena vulgaris]|nr:cytochrome P450 [Mycena vulgaris]